MAPHKRLIRRQPLMQRIKSYLDPWDFLLWASEELESSEWEQWQNDWAVPIGIAINLIMLVARANSRGGADDIDDVFGDDSTRMGFGSWLATFTVHLLTLISVLNTLYTFLRARHYRLFEVPVDDVPSTPSARRVRVDSSPVSSSPLRLLSSFIPSTDSAASRAYPDPQTDVWELAVWDPLSICLRTFCLFSPGHVLVYWLFLPVRDTDPHPSVTIATTILLAALLSGQLLLFRRSFSQQAKDTALVHKEVLHEYDAKFVNPRTRRLMRDVGTQFSGHPPADRRRSYQAEVNGIDVHPINLGRSFQIRPNPNYASQIDPKGGGYAETPTRRPQHPAATRSSAVGPDSSVLRPIPQQPRDLSSPLVQRSAAAQARQPYHASTGTGDGGSLGVYTHERSPLKKAASTHFAPRRQVHGDPRRESGRL